MGADLELLARLLVDMWRAQHREFLDFGRQRDRTTDARTGPFGSIDDLASRLVENAVIIGPQANADVLIVDCHFGFQFLRPRVRSFARCYFMILATTPAPTVRP